MSDNNIANPSFHIPSLSKLNNTVLIFKLIVHDGTNESKPDFVNVTVRGIVQSINENSPKDLSVTLNAILTIKEVIPTFITEDPHSKVTVKGKLSDLSGNGIMGEDLGIRLYRVSGNATIFEDNKKTVDSGLYSYSFSDVNLNQGRYGVSVQPSDSRYSGSKVIKEFEVGPRPLSAADVSTYIGLIATAAALVTIGPRWLHGKKERKNLSMYINKIDYKYNTLDKAKKDESQKQLKEIKYELYSC